MSRNGMEHNRWTGGQATNVRKRGGEFKTINKLGNGKIVFMNQKDIDLLTGAQKMTIKPVRRTFNERSPFPINVGLLSPVIPPLIDAVNPAARSAYAYICSMFRLRRVQNLTIRRKYGSNN